MSIPITAILALLIQSPAPMHPATTTAAPRSAETPPTPPPAQVPSPETAPKPVTEPTPPPRSAPSERSRRHLRVGGFVALGLGGGLVGLMASAAASHVATLERLGAREAALAPGQPVTRLTRDQVQNDLHWARVDRDLAIGAGVSAAVCLALATTFFTLGRERGPSRRRLALAPTWLPSGAALHLQIRLP